MSRSFFHKPIVRWMLAAVMAVSLSLAFLCLVSGAERMAAENLTPLPPLLRGEGESSAPSLAGKGVGGLGRAMAMAADPDVPVAPAGASTSHERSHIYVYAIPGSDGASLYVAAGGMGQLATDVYASVSSTSHERSHTLAYSPTTGEYAHTFEGMFTPGIWDGGNITISTTVTASLGSSAYVRYYVPGMDPVNLPSNDNQLNLYLNPGSLAPESYVVIMPTAALPGDPPPGHRLISQAYSLRASGAVTESLAPMLLTMRYAPALLGAADPHTLAIFFWDAGLGQWQDIESIPLSSEPAHTQSVNRFGIYALMTGATWRDPLLDYLGLAEWQNVRLAYGGRLALRSGYAEGDAVSVPITPPTPFAAWGQLRYSAEITAGAALTVDVLAADGTLLLADLPDGADLARLAPAAQPSLRLRARLRTQQSGVTPYLDGWAVSWRSAAQEHKRYLPLLAVGAGEQGSRGAEEQGSKGVGEMNAAGASHRVTSSPLHLVTSGCDPPADPPIVWSAPVRIAGADQTTIAPALAVDPAGGLHAVWYNGSRLVFYASKAPGAAAWTTPVAISQGRGAYYPAIAVDPRGNVHVLWEENDDVFYVTKPSGGGWTAPVNASHTGQANLMPAIAADASCTLHAVWSDGSPGNDAIFYASKGCDAGAWSAAERVSHTAGRSWAPVVAADAQGGVHVAWHDLTPGPTEIYYAEKPAGGAWSDSQRVSKTIGGSVFPALAVDRRGTVHLAWQDSVTASAPPFQILYAARPAGGAWSESRQLSRGAANAESPTLAVGPEDDLHVAWDTSDTHGLLYVTRPAPDMGWTAPMTVTAIAPGTIYPFPALAAGPDGTIHLLWGDAGLSNIFYSAAARPPIPDEHVLVLDEDGFAVEGACIYRDGQLVGATNRLGIAVPENLADGERLVALKPLAEETAAPGRPWAYRTALTSLNMDAVGVLSGYTVTTPGPYHLTVYTQTPLIYFNLLVSIQWNATPEYVQDLANGLRLASDYLFDVSDGQMAFGHIAIYDDASQWGNADIQILTRSDVRPYSYVGGIVSADRSHVIRVGRHWDGNSGAQGDWSAANGYRTLIHEFGHYALHLYDSYFEYLYDPRGNLLGINEATGCTEVDPSGYREADDPIRATIMDYQYRTSELAARGVSGLWEADICPHTVQWQMTQRELRRVEGESDWETLLRYYADAVDPPRWQITNPITSGHVLTGPVALPANLLAFPETAIFESGADAPPRQLTVFGADGRPYTQGALVALDTRQAGRPVTLDQGLTASGQITIYGAATGDTLRAVSLDGALSAQVAATAALAYTLTLRSSVALRAAGAAFNPYAIVIPGSDGRDLSLAVAGVGPGGHLSSLITAPGAPLGHTVALGYSPADDVYTGTASFVIAGTGLGSVNVHGVGSLGQIAAIDSDFVLAQVDASAAHDLYTPDGQAWLHLDAASFPVAEIYMALMPTGAAPQPLPAGMTMVGAAYSLQPSGGHVTLARPGILRLFDAADAANGAAAQIARWDGAGWRLLPSEPNPERLAVSARVSQLGIYALLVEEGARERIYLPVIVR